jgi:hypothetical protein
MLIVVGIVLSIIGVLPLSVGSMLAFVMFILRLKSVGSIESGGRLLSNAGGTVCKAGRGRGGNVGWCTSEMWEEVRGLCTGVHDLPVFRVFGIRGSVL